MRRILLAALVSQVALVIAVICLTSTDARTEVEFYNLPDRGDQYSLDVSKKLVDFLETNGIFRESEAVAGSGEDWLVLQRRYGDISLISAQSTLTKKQTVSYAGPEQDVELSFLGISSPIFAITNVAGVKPGRVTTLFCQPRRNGSAFLSDEEMKTGYKRSFKLNENWYTLRVSRGQTQTGRTIGLLVLEGNGTMQLIARNLYQPDFGEIIGNLLWAGDLDGDGKLDLYFDHYNEKGSLGTGLYLSSHADEGKLVKLVATFSTLGC